MISLSAFIMLFQSTLPQGERRLVQEGMLMSTYEELQIILGVAMLIVAILNLTHKK